MEDELIELLNTLSYPVLRQGSLSPTAKYPDTFITFWNNETIEHSAYDNESISEDVDFDVNVYSNNPTTTYDLLDNIKALLKSNNWVIYDRGHDVASDEVSHTGRGISITYLNNI